MKVIQPSRVVSTDGTAQIQCFVQPQPSYHQIQPSDDQTLTYPYPDPEELRVSLLRGLHGTQELCSTMLNFTEQREAGVEKGAEKDREVSLCVDGYSNFSKIMLKVLVTTLNCGS